MALQRPSPSPHPQPHPHPHPNPVPLPRTPTRYVPLQRGHNVGEKVFDLRKDPEQKDDIRHTSRGKLVAARLGQRYEEARSEAISRRNTAQAEGRMKGPNQGRGLGLPPGDYFCHHVRDAWFDETWGEVKADMCTGRREEERISRRGGVENSSSLSISSSRVPRGQ